MTAVGVSTGQHGHPEGRHQKLPLADACLGRIAISQLAKLWQMAPAFLNLPGEGIGKAEPFKGVLQAAAMHAHGKGAKGIVAGMGQGFLEVYPAVHRPVAFPDVGIPDLQPAATFKVFIEVRHLFIQGGIRNQHLDGGARRIKAIGSPVQERAVLPLG